MEVKEIMLETLKEMSEISLADCENVQEYAVLCSAMSDVYRELKQG